THADPPTLDVFNANIAHNAVGPYCYSSLLQFKPGYLKPSEKEISGDLAESWEWSPDGREVIMKIRQGVKWHNKQPVNARLIDIDDVTFSWNRFAAKNSGRAGVANAVNPDAPVLSLTATDA